ncbi:hypothetical protein PIB30_071139 [Stylosanthes scabra]|uniref:Uncharacterized protein n=1 Tax=Stylosanthes scabra TaxID=79078 RepID=A0ABU6QQW2_9FABA|nr:hypothetical protein [Stylosanthes scabra]
MVAAAIQNYFITIIPMLPKLCREGHRDPDSKRRSWNHRSVLGLPSLSSRSATSRCFGSFFSPSLWPLLQAVAGSFSGVIPWKDSRQEMRRLHKDESPQQPRQKTCIIHHRDDVVLGAAACRSCVLAIIYTSYRSCSVLRHRHCALSPRRSTDLGAVHDSTFDDAITAVLSLICHVIAR